MKVAVGALKAGRGYHVLVRFSDPADRLKFFRLLRKREAQGGCAVEGTLTFDG